MPRSTARHIPRLIALAAIVACAGCGPFGYLKKVASEATRAVAEAEAAGAEEYAPYEYWGAVTYLEQAKVLMGYSEYERSFDFGERAKDLAKEAKLKAQRVKKGGSVVQDEDIAAPTDMVDQEGKPVDTLEEAQSGGDADADADADADGEGEVEGKASGKLEIGGGE
ncbi:DUF4398 domain-containing protein [Pseudenhygromyxa sp. WMMC2535]|uniref:DUF4398 domain-containing protein n=1 Tax=Pseudenhygromyxa sp. WMMC2535 TaxID=2712867 RepID=UPI00155567FB|nr:DUF4398 domain-containing protein [Pseudenhygromyxa sp. WMMC2535]